MAWRIVWPGSTKSRFRWAMGGVKAKVNRPMWAATWAYNKPMTNTTPNTKPVQVKKPIKKF